MSTTTMRTTGIIRIRFPRGPNSHTSPKGRLGVMAPLCLGVQPRFTGLELTVNKAQCGNLVFGAYNYKLEVKRNGQFNSKTGDLSAYICLSQNRNENKSGYFICHNRV